MAEGRAESHSIPDGTKQTGRRNGGLTDRIQVSYTGGRAQITLPVTMKVPGRQRKRIPIMLEVTIEQANALRDALLFTNMWMGDGFTHYDWPATPVKQKRKVKQKA